MVIDGQDNDVKGPNKRSGNALVVFAQNDEEWVREKERSRRRKRDRDRYRVIAKHIVDKCRIYRPFD